FEAFILLAINWAPLMKKAEAFNFGLLTVIGTLQAQYLFTARYTAHTTTDHFNNRCIANRLQKCIEFVAGTSNLNDVKRAGDIHDLATKNIYAAFDFCTLCTCRFHFYQHEFALDVRAFGEVYQLNNIN